MNDDEKLFRLTLSKNPDDRLLYYELIKSQKINIDDIYKVYLDYWDKGKFVINPDYYTTKMWGISESIKCLVLHLPLGSKVFFHIKNDFTNHLNNAFYLGFHNSSNLKFTNFYLWDYWKRELHYDDDKHWIEEGDISDIKSIKQFYELVHNAIYDCLKELYEEDDYEDYITDKIDY